MSGTGGLSYGIGGSYEGELSYANGTLVFRSKGKAAVGLGFTYGMSAEINFGGLIAKLFGY